MAFDACMMRAVLSEFTPDSFALAVASGDAKAITRAKGIGPKAAQRIIVDLRDKIGSLGIDASAAPSASSAASPGVNAEVLEEAVSALTMLGFSPAPSHKVAQQILRQEPQAPVERVIKLALKML